MVITTWFEIYGAILGTGLIGYGVGIGIGWLLWGFKEDTNV